MVLRNYIYEKNFQMYVFEDMINILNYKDIVSFTDSKVIIECENKSLYITGKNLIISKLLIDELLIKGDINLIEFR